MARFGLSGYNNWPRAPHRIVWQSGTTTYVIGIDSTSNTQIRVGRSTTPTTGSWTYVNSNSTNHGFRNLAAWLYNGVIYIAGVSDASSSADMDLVYAEYTISSNSFTQQPTILIDAYDPGSYDSSVAIVANATHTVIGFSSAAEKVHGSDYTRLSYVRDTGSGFGSRTDLSPHASAQVQYLNVAACEDTSDDTIHLFYKDDTNSDGYHRSLNSSGTLSSAEAFDTTMDGGNYAIGEPVYLLYSTTDRIQAPYRDSGSGAATTEVDNDGTPGNNSTITTTAVSISSNLDVVLIAEDSADTVHALFVDSSTNDIWYDVDSGSGWGTDTEIEDAVTAGKLSAAPYVDDSKLRYVYEDSSTLYYNEYSLSTSNNGTLNETLGALTLSATGEVDIDGSLSETLGALTLSGSGDVQNNATLSETLGALTLAGAGDVQNNATLSETLDALTLAGTAQAIASATLSETLDTLTLSATATNPIDGNLSETLEALTLSSTGTVDIDGNLSETLDALTLSGSGDVQNNATLSETLGALTLAGTGVVGNPPIEGTLSETLDALTLSSTGTVDIDGNLSETLDALTLSSTGTVDIDGNLSKTLDALTLSGSGDVQNDATLSETLDALTLAGTGVTGNPPIEGTLSETLDALTLSSTGTVDIDGNLSETLEALTLSSTGTVDIDGNLSETLEALTLSGTGTVTTIEITGTLSETLEALTLSSTGTVDIDGNLSETLGLLTLAASAGVLNTGVLNSNLGTLTLSATGAQGEIIVGQPDSITITEYIPTITITEDIPTITITEDIPTITITEDISTITITEDIPTITFSE